MKPSKQNVHVLIVFFVLISIIRKIVTCVDHMLMEKYPANNLLSMKPYF